MSFQTEILLPFEKGILLTYGHRIKLFRLVGSLREDVSPHGLGKQADE